MDIEEYEKELNKGPTKINGDVIMPGYRAQIEFALEEISKYSHIDAHKQWLFDRIVRILTGCPIVEKSTIGGTKFKTLGENQKYRDWFKQREDEGGWDTGIAP